MSGLKNQAPSAPRVRRPKKTRLFYKLDLFIDIIKIRKTQMSTADIEILAHGLGPFRKLKSRFCTPGLSKFDFSRVVELYHDPKASVKISAQNIEIYGFYSNLNYFSDFHSFSTWGPVQVCPGC